MADGASPLDALEIRSYRTVFDLERRLYRIDRLRLNPGGVPVRGMLYFVALVIATAAASQLPIAGGLVRLLPWYVRDIALPAGTATLLTLIRIDGRPFHLVVRALVRHRLTRSRICRLGCGAAPRTRWRPPDLVYLPDGSEHRVRRFRYRGPGAVLVTVAHERVEWQRGPLARALSRPDLTVRQLAPARALARAQVVELGPGCRLTLTSASSRRPTPASRGSYAEAPVARPSPEGGR